MSTPAKNKISSVSQEGLLSNLFKKIFTGADGQTSSSTSDLEKAKQLFEQKATQAARQLYDNPKELNQLSVKNGTVSGYQMATALNGPQTNAASILSQIKSHYATVRSIFAQAHKDVAAVKTWMKAMSKAIETLDDAAAWRFIQGNKSSLKQPIQAAGLNLSMLIGTAAIRRGANGALVVDEVSPPADKDVQLPAFTSAELRAVGKALPGIFTDLAAIDLLTTEQADVDEDVFLPEWGGDATQRLVKLILARDDQDLLTIFNRKFAEYGHSYVLFDLYSSCEDMAFALETWFTRSIEWKPEQRKQFSLESYAKEENLDMTNHALNKLRHQRDVISLEAVSGEGALQQATGRLSSFFQNAKSFFSKFVTSNLTPYFDVGSLKWIARRTQKVSYADLRVQEVTVPPGLKCDYLTYVASLSKSAEAVKTLDAHVLTPFVTWLGQKVGNPSSLASLTNSLNIDGYKPSATEKLQESLQACFHPSGRAETKSTYGQAIKRNADWGTLADEMDALRLQFSDKSHARILDLMARAENLLDVLMTRVKEEPELYKMSSATVQALAATTFAIASELEFYGLLRHRIQELNVALEETTIWLGKSLPASN